jgi:hypothetical protein
MWTTRVWQATLALRAELLVKAVAASSSFEASVKWRRRKKMGSAKDCSSVSDAWLDVRDGACAHSPEPRDLHDRNERGRPLGVGRGGVWHVLEDLVPDVGLLGEMVGAVHGEDRKEAGGEEWPPSVKTGRGSEDKAATWHRDHWRRRCACQLCAMSLCGQCRWLEGSVFNPKDEEDEEQEPVRDSESAADSAAAASLFLS